MNIILKYIVDRMFLKLIKYIIINNNRHRYINNNSKSYLPPRCLETKRHLIKH